MKLYLEFSDVSKTGIKKSFVSKIVLSTLERVPSCELARKIFSLSVAVLPEEEMSRLNKKYRRKNGPTDVLSFSEYEKLEDIEKAKEKEVYLGEIIICFEDISKYVQEKNIPLKKELAKTISHGTLHLLGFSHGEKMFSIQEEIASSY